ncbi:hypothetical protein ACFL57_04935 [Candidatus Margulisiibacteriota bacterium]
MLKLISFAMLFITTFLRVWVPLIICLILREFIQRGIESIFCPKKHSKVQLLNPFGSFFFPFILYSFRITIGSSLIFGWTKPKYNNDLTTAQNLLVAVSGPLFHLLLALLLNFFAFHVWGFNMLIEGNLRDWFLAPWIKDIIEINFVLFLVNLLPFYPFDMSRMLAPFFMKKDGSHLLAFQVTGLWMTLLIFISPYTWALIDKAVRVFVSLV